MSIASTIHLPQIQAVPSFDWQRVFAQHRPAPDTPTQAARLAMLPSLMADLHVWARRFDLTVERAERLEASAFVMASVLPSSSTYAQTLLLAKYALWVWALDHFMDAAPFERIHADAIETKLIEFDRRLAPVTRLFYDIGGLTDDIAQRCGLGPRIDAHVNVGSAEVQAGEGLGAAFVDLYQTLAACCRAESQPGRAFCLTNFIRQVALVVGAMRGEVQQSFVYQQTSAQPNLEEYLKHGCYSMAIIAFASVALGFEVDPQAVWEPWEAALHPGSRAMRIANDLGGMWREWEERKVNSVTITLAALGVDLSGSFQNDGRDITLAKIILRRRRDHELDQFAARISGLSDGPLATFVVRCTAFTIAMYEKGDCVPLE